MTGFNRVFFMLLYLNLNNYFQIKKVILNTNEKIWYIKL